MNPPSIPSTSENGFLCSLSNEALSLLRPHLEFVELPVHYMNHKRGAPIKFVYFPTEGLVSLVIESGNGDAAEIGVAGKETIAGAPGALHFHQSPVTEIVQIAGSGFRIRVDKIRQILKQNTEIRDLFARHQSLLAMRVAQTAGCNAMHSAEQRLARWLLMASDRVAANPLPLAQEFLGILLGVSRQRVSATVNTLQRKGCIRLRRKSIEIISRSALKQCSCECYSVVAGLNLAHASS